MGGAGGRSGFSLIKHATLAAARLDRAVQRGRLAGTRTLGALLADALDPAEMSALTIALYGLYPVRASAAGLDDWESDWYADCLPPAPARLLVTAAGTGREVVALRAMGYAVDAFEPAPGQAAMIAHGPGDLVLDATYDDLVRAARGDASSPAAEIVARRYDAVILGWGSFTHLLERRQQTEVLAACDAVCPEGPILASFWGAVGAAPVSRARDVGGRLGRSLARLRTSRAPARSAGRLAGEVGFAFNVGFTRRFSRGDVVTLAAEIGREVTLFGLRPYGHATLTPLR